MLAAGLQAAPAGPALPASVTSFLGRERELHEVAELLSHRRLVTLTGAGGTGKTRLALAVASAVRAQFADGAAFVPLAALRDPDLVAPAIARALSVREARKQPWLDRLRDYLRSRRLLLVLDNFEQVAGAAPLLPGLLAACPGLTALVTCRGQLHVSAKQVYPVTPLPVLDPRRPPDVEELRRIPSVALFVERARAVAPGFALTAQNAEPIMEICVRLEGLPLALELAAVRAALLSPAALLRRLERRLTFLQGGLRDQPEWHQTLRAAIAWSYDLLPAEEQRHFRHLALFVGGFTLEALAAITGEGEEDALEAVARLGDQSLVLREDTPTGESRFQMLETIREFAWEQLEESGELAAAQRRHAEYFLSLAEQAEDQEAWLDRLEREHDNLRATLAWSTAADVDLALRFVGALWWFWDTRGHVQEGRQWCRRALAAEGGAPGLRAKALNTAGLLAQGQADSGPAVALLTEALALWRRLGDRSGVAIALNNLAVIARNQGDHQRVRALCEEALAALRRLGERQSAKDRQVLALVLYKLGWALGMEGDHERAAEWHTESRAIFEGTGERRGMARVHGSLGELALQRRDLAAAQDHFSRSLDLNRAIGDR